MSVLKELSLFAKNYSILIVEDQKDLNNELVEICQLFFKEVDTASDGEEALLKYKNNLSSYDIILSDITMPKINGVLLSREIKTINRFQNIIILSAHSEMEYLIELIDIGITQFISKPFEEKELLFRLLKVCENIFYKKEYIKMVVKNNKIETNHDLTNEKLQEIITLKNRKKIENDSEHIVSDIEPSCEKEFNIMKKNSNVNDVITHKRVTASNFLKSIQSDDYVWTVMESQIDELLILIDEFNEEIEKFYLNKISPELILNVALILRKIYSIFSFLDELTRLSRVILDLVVFLESINLEILTIERINKLKILEFIYDDISRFIETVFVYKDTLDISYLEDSLSSSIEQLKMVILGEKIEEEELELF